MKRTTYKKETARRTRHTRVRMKILGTNKRPRLSVFRSLRSMYAQLVDDTARKTLVSMHSSFVKASGKKTEIAHQVGLLLAQKAKEKGITSVVFDRGGYKYHGRVKAVADGAREGGLVF